MLFKLNINVQIEIFFNKLFPDFNWTFYEFLSLLISVSSFRENFLRVSNFIVSFSKNKNGLKSISRVFRILKKKPIDQMLKHA